MKIAWFKKNISPEVGAFLAGYGLDYRSKEKLDDLYASGLCMDDGQEKVLLISFDLLGLDEWYIKDLRQKCAELLNVPVSAVMFSCTHTHTGPETRTLAAAPQQLNKPYLEELQKIVLQAVRELGPFQECRARFYASLCDENRNRRYTSGDNHASFTPHRREFINARNGITDQELGVLWFADPQSGDPIYVVGNYAAHPLAGHSPGIGGKRISADFPGAFCQYVSRNTGAETMFVSGAAGDLVPIEDELGDEAFRSVGIRLGKEAIGGIVDSHRNPARFAISDPKLGHAISTFTVPLRKAYRTGVKPLPLPYEGQKDVTLEIQTISIGDIAFVGVPGELCTELGLEIKWHSPFRKTFIAYCATAYFSYLCPANFLVSGGYEAGSQRFSARGGLQLVNTAVEQLFDLHEKLFPSDPDDPYPDNNFTPLVNILPNRNPSE